MSVRFKDLCYVTMHLLRFEPFISEKSNIVGELTAGSQCGAAPVASTLPPVERR